MRKLNRRGTAALEFALVAVPLFTSMFIIFDLGRYAITMQSLHALANAEARAIMISVCYTTAVTSKASPSGCTSDQMLTADKKAVAPFLYAGGLTPTVSISASANTMTIRVAQRAFTMMMPIWGATLNAPSVSTSIPF
jgi:Flp pilus assembly protein TadG